MFKVKSLLLNFNVLFIQKRNSFLPLEPLLCCFLCCLLACFFSLLPAPTRPEWPLVVAIHQALVNCLSQVPSSLAKLRMAPKAGPLGHLELSQSPIEVALSFSLTQHWFLAVSKLPGSVIWTPQQSDYWPRLNRPVLQRARVLVHAQQ